jgi:hypothetical protein
LAETTKIAAVLNRPALPNRPGRLSEFSRAVPQIVLHEWRALLQYHPNMLLEGNESDLEETLVALKKDFYPRLVSWVETDPMFDPGVHASIIVREIARLPASSRDGLHRWLASASRPIQIVSTSSIPLFPLVERNEFPAGLYYRLNVIRLTVDC